MIDAILAAFPSAIRVFNQRQPSSRWPSQHPLPLFKQALNRNGQEGGNGRCPHAHDSRILPMDGLNGVANLHLFVSSWFPEFHVSVNKPCAKCMMNRWSRNRNEPGNDVFAL